VKLAERRESPLQLGDIADVMLIPGFRSLRRLAVDASFQADSRLARWHLAAALAGRRSREFRRVGAHRYELNLAGIVQHLDALPDGETAECASRWRDGTRERGKSAELKAPLAQDRVGCWGFGDSSST